MYQLVFKGECVPGTDEQTARRNAMALFKATLDQVDRMFSGNRVVIRNKLDEAQAAKYEAVLRKHGMVVHVEPMGGAPTSTAPSPAPAAQPARPEPAPRSEPLSRAQPETAESEPAASGGGVPVEPGDRLQVAGEKVDSILAGSSLKLDGAHDRLSETREVEPPLFDHLDDWTLAPPGSTLVETRDEVPPVVPDISHLSLVDNDEDRK
ncbi:hypothetical protein RE428_06490 [Marinobacter nanhaiticus D15-8W]|uniref:Uncharacterized protein n=1 Tax=Marinobacter nanhaiticus D15-8W TaxID=626887 RepID=N6WT62_9GAMM|nr:hypothetical protein [Marinobacter nanhaiticus]ENO14681.1 hypothetical protein J057_05001 [Marinobacter nanhaiticus D15-8W]BES69631.1 hypothetical protein RE428_06490 [Marinobacter nanhaiticus D15-8W]